MTEKEQTERIKQLNRELDTANDTVAHLQETIIALREEMDRQEFSYLDQLEQARRTARREQEVLQETIIKLRAQLDAFVEHAHRD